MQKKLIPEYTEIFIKQIDKLRLLKEKRDAINEEMRLVHQMAKAAFAMMSPQEREVCDVVMKSLVAPVEGLTQAIRNVLFNNYARGWLTPVFIKDALEKDGYDFSVYQSNPLSSIHSVLKRFKRSEVTGGKMVDNSTGYRLTRKAYEARKLMENPIIPAQLTEEKERD